MLLSNGWILLTLSLISDEVNDVLDVKCLLVNGSMHYIPMECDGNYPALCESKIENDNLLIKTSVMLKGGNKLLSFVSDHLTFSVKLTLFFIYGKKHNVMCFDAQEVVCH